MGAGRGGGAPAPEGVPRAREPVVGEEAETTGTEAQGRGGTAITVWAVGAARPSRGVEAPSACVDAVGSCERSRHETRGRLAKEDSRDGGWQGGRTPYCRVSGLLEQDSGADAQ